MSEKKKINLTLICLYNNPYIFENQLLDSLKRQSVEVELIAHKNMNGQVDCFPSAAKGYNELVRKSKGDHFLFVHQDIIFKSADSLEKLYNYMLKYPMAVIGVAGTLIGDKTVYSSVVEEGISERMKSIMQPMKVDVLDECCFGMSKELYERIRFDEETCSGWHFYAVDFCYSAAIRNYEIYVVPAELIHTSGGNIQHDFFVRLKPLRKKHHKNFPVIRSCCIEVYRFVPNIFYEIKYLKRTYLMKCLDKIGVKLK